MLVGLVRWVQCWVLVFGELGQVSPRVRSFLLAGAPSSREAMRKLFNSPSVTPGASPPPPSAVTGKAVHSLVAVDDLESSSGYSKQLVYVAGRDKTIRAYTASGSIAAEVPLHHTATTRRRPP